MGHSEFGPAILERRPWNAGRMVGAKRALKPQQVWAIRFWLDRERRLRDRALFDLAIDSKLRGCDVVKIRIGELVSGGRVRARATVTQQKTGRPVQFELLEAARSSLQAWLERRGGTIEDYASPSRTDHTRHLGTRQYMRLVDEWVNRHRSTVRRLRHALAPTDQGVNHLQSHRQSAGGAAAPGSHQDREHGALPRGRCGRRAHPGRAHGGMTTGRPAGDRP